MEYTERQRQDIINLIFHLNQKLDRIGGNIARVELKDLSSYVADADEAVSLFLKQLRVNQ